MNRVVEIAYAYPTSPMADKYAAPNGCYYWATREEQSHRMIAMDGPFDTWVEADGAARFANPGTPLGRYSMPKRA